MGNILESVLDAGVVGPSAVALPDGCPTLINGGPLHYENRISTHGYSRFRLTCGAHQNCCKFRGDGANQRNNLGRYEPVAYLGVWSDLAFSDLPIGDHADKENLKHITVQKMRDWLISNSLPVG